MYLRGLLLAERRKTIRTIGAHVGGAAMEHSLHHLSSSSTWDWMPVRRALAGHLQQVSVPHVGVVRPMPIPKVGDRSVGVHEGLDPGTDQTFHGQRGFGLWHVSDTLDVPVNRRLFLPSSGCGTVRGASGRDDGSGRAGDLGAVRRRHGPGARGRLAVGSAGSPAARRASWAVAVRVDTAGRRIPHPEVRPAGRLWQRGHGGRPCEGRPGTGVCPREGGRPLPRLCEEGADSRRRKSRA
ncbi:transposase [Streptomyces mirabilis]|uniref:transposase n=1 Tax=Streptomyces mirabilis TaxID=68239 RepID=UPI0033256FAD